MEDTKTEGQGQATAQQPTMLHISMPRGVGLHLLQSMEPTELTDEETTQHNVFAEQMAQLFTGLRDGSIESGVVLVKRRIDKVPEGETEVQRGFALEGSIVGAPEECTYLLMHLTEIVQQEAARLNPVPEGLSEADRCPGCGGFHTNEDGDRDLAEGASELSH